jgi:RNA recognition motif-containing protein
MTSIFVAKLDFGVSKEQLVELFTQYGEVSKAHLPTDKDTGKPRGFAFVEMSNDDEAGKAIEALDGFEINRRRIAVKVA